MTTYAQMLQVLRTIAFQLRDMANHEEDNPRKELLIRLAKDTEAIMTRLRNAPPKPGSAA
jgi:hypothetical protein